jgi:RNA polymerase sigma-70 factor (ECF subfamily)
MVFQERKRMDERKAIEQLKQGDIQGLETLVRAYQVQAVRAACLVTHDRRLAEEIVQAAFLRSYERIEQFDVDRSFGPWFLRIVVNDAVKATARRKRTVPLEREAGEAGTSLADLLPDPDPGPAELAEAEEARQAVWTALGQLPPTQRGAIVLRYYLDLGEAEMAERWSCPRGTVKWRLYAARERLRTLLHRLRPRTASGE